LAEFGEPLFLPRSGACLLKRRINGSDLSDAMGPYPLLFCRDWRALGDDLADLEHQLVSVVAVADPFAVEGMGTPEDAFDQVVPFKDHFVAELNQAPEQFVRKSHQVHARKALRSVDVQVCGHPWDYHDEWVSLYANLTRRHAISGIRAFSPRAFERQLKTLGMVMFRAKAGDEVVGMDLWFQQGDVAYGHLAAFSDLGYRIRASYATKWTVLHHFMGRVQWVDFAGSAGVTDNESDGLASFKSGWSTGRRTAFLCTRVLQPDTYLDLSQRHGNSASRYFPAYRAGEFG
jgi:hypothetical protein